MRWYVDGMNVIGTGGAGFESWWRDRDRAMAHLVDLLERWAAVEGEDVVVVFERAPRPPMRSTVIEIAHAPRPRADAADFEIARRVSLEPHPALVRVVTSDRWLADRVQATGVAVHGADMFRSMIDGG
jgi:predicted RNA-binding protein with PIN domain